MPDNEMTFWQVYDRPPEYPTGYMAQRVEIRIGSLLPVLTDDTFADGSLEVVRAWLSKRGLFRVTRWATGDPRIIEVWIA